MEEKTKKRLEYALRCIDGVVIPTGAIRQLRYISRETSSWNMDTANVMGLAADVMKLYAIYKVLF